MAIKLSFDKLESILSRSKFTAVGMWIDSGQLKFLECRTPKQQKTFIIYIPDKYHIPVSNQQSGSLSSDYQITTIRQLSDVDMGRIRKLLDLRGDSVICDLISISSDGILYLREGGDKRQYKFGSSDSLNADHSEDESDISEASDIAPVQTESLNDIEGKLASIQKDMGINPLSDEPNSESTFTDSENLKIGGDDATDNEDDAVHFEPDFVQVREAAESDSEEETVLQFQDEEGNEVDEVKHVIDTGDIEKEAQKITDELTSVSLKSRKFDNSTPKELLEKESHLGIVYIMIPLPKFIRDISSVEEEIISCYEGLDNVEKEQRERFLSLISEIYQQFTQKSRQRIEDIAKEELEIKNQLTRLTIVLAQLYELRNKEEDNNDDRVERLISKTKDTMNDMHLKLLRSRENATNILLNYKICLDDLMGI
jgi:hypothetical protein